MGNMQSRTNQMMAVAMLISGKMNFMAKTLYGIKSINT